MIDLNSNFARRPKDAAAKEPAEGAGTLSVPTPVELTVVSKVGGLTATTANSKDVLAGYVTLVFLLDISISMSDALIDGSDIAQFMWLPEEMAEVDAKIGRAAEQLTQGIDSSEFPDMIQLQCWASLSAFEGDALKQRILELGFQYQMKLQVNWEMQHTIKKTKLDLVKEQCAAMVAARFAKYKQPATTVVAFDTDATVVGHGNEAAIQQAILGLSYGGGTDITMAVVCALSVCAACPSPINAHHFVLISDGADQAVTTRLPELLPELLERNAVLDFIHISQDPTEEQEPAIQAIKSVCAATRGEYARVADQRSFVDRFIQASSKLCLPPGTC